MREGFINNPDVHHAQCCFVKNNRHDQHDRNNAEKAINLCFFAVLHKEIRSIIQDGVGIILFLILRAILSSQNCDLGLCKITVIKSSVR